MPNPSDDQQSSDAALSVYRIIPPSHLAEPWAGEPYAIQLTDENDRPVWYPAYDDVASVHGRRLGWDRVAAVVPPGHIHNSTEDAGQ